MTKATQNGNCQYCGCEHAVNAKTGRLALHGYVVKWNSFQNDCGGSKERPLQVERKLTDAYVAKLREEAVDLRVLAGTITPMMEGLTLAVHDHLGYAQRCELEKPCSGWNDADRHAMKVLRATRYTREKALELGCNEHDWDNSTRRYIASLMHDAEAREIFATQMEAMADRIHGQPLIARYDASKPARVRKEFSWRTEAKESYEFVRLMKEQGRNPIHRRPNYGSIIYVTYDAKEGE